jgi:photosystem II stability/assembly factor-like uncharacterized protein
MGLGERRNIMLILAARSGVWIGERPGEGQLWRATRRGPDGELPVTSVAVQNNVILAGTRKGIYRSDDNGLTWSESNRGLTQPYIRWLAADPVSAGHFLAGTEPAGIFYSSDGGRSWQEALEVARLRDQFRWFLPYSSGDGCVRGFTFNGRRVYAAVEVGGALCSDDGGISWRLVEGSSGSPATSGLAATAIHPDVHSILVHPSSPDAVYAPTGGGFYRSSDGGRTWRLLYRCYCRTVWVNPQDANHLILGPADNVDANGRIEESRDGGETWQPASDGLETPWRRHMVERFVKVDGELIAILSNGQVIAADLSATPLVWSPILADVKDVDAAVAA